jgi:hypothetical protein
MDREHIEHEHGEDEDFDPEDARDAGRGARGGTAIGRYLVIALALALTGALGGMLAYGRKASTISAALEELRREQRMTQLQAPAGIQTLRVRPVRMRPERATIAPGWSVPPQLLELHIDSAEGKYTQFQITIDKLDAGRVLQLRRVARDSNRELRLALNSSAFGPGEYLVEIQGYTWRGQVEPYGWVRLDLR